MVKTKANIHTSHIISITIENANCCPECYHQKRDDCELCEGDTDENGLSDLKATVPWDLCKQIWLRMNKIYAEQLHEEQNQ